MAVGFLEDFVGGFGPDEWVGAVVPAVDVGADSCGEVADAAERAAVNGLALNDAEPDLDYVHPGRRGRSEMHSDAGANGPVKLVVRFGPAGCCW